MPASARKGDVEKKEEEDEVKCVLSEPARVLKRSNLFTYSNEDSMFSAFWHDHHHYHPPYHLTLLLCCKCVSSIHVTYDKMRCAFTLNEDEDTRRRKNGAERSTEGDGTKKN